jgi:outer membrane protein assembly factor BamE (lipoprotein component of BamABCDE complex)
MSRRNILTAAALAAAFSTVAPIAAPVAIAAPSAHFTLHVTPQYPLDDAAVARIRDGMTTDQVRGLIGAPWNTVRFDNTHTTAWDYEYRDGWGYDAVFSVVFDDTGIVVGRISVRRDA